MSLCSHSPLPLCAAFQLTLRYAESSVHDFLNEIPRVHFTNSFSKESFAHMASNDESEKPPLAWIQQTQMFVRKIISAMSSLFFVRYYFRFLQISLHQQYQFTCKVSTGEVLFLFLFLSFISRLYHSHFLANKSRKIVPRHQNVWLERKYRKKSV